MKSMVKWSLRLLTLMSVILIVSACGNGESGDGDGDSDVKAKKDGYTIKVSAGSTEDHPIGQGLNKFKELVEEKSDGRINVQLHLGGQLGDDVKTIDSLKAGSLEMTTVITAPIVGTVKEFGIFDLPFAINNNEEADAVLQSPVADKLMELLPEHGLVGVNFWEFGFYDLTNNKRAVTSVEDLSGLKIRTLQNEIHVDSFNTLGANAVPMGYPEVFSSLESGVIDAQVNPVQGVKTHKFYEVQNHFTSMNLVYSPVVLLMSKKFQDKISEEDFVLIQEAAMEAGDYERELLRAEYDSSLEFIEENGMEISEFSEEEKDKAREILKPVYEKYTKKLGEEIVEEYFAEIEKLR